jgi:hypothetical protein
MKSNIGFNSKMMDTISYNVADVSLMKYLDMQDKVLLACGRVFISDESKYIESYDKFVDVVNIIKHDLKFLEDMEKVYEKNNK